MYTYKSVVEKLSLDAIATYVSSYTADLSVKEDHLLEVRLVTTFFILPLVDHQQGDRVRFHGNQGSLPLVLLFSA